MAIEAKATVSSQLVVSAMILPLVLLSACVEPPERACDRVRFSWPNFLIEPSQDVSDDVGIQVSFSLSSDLLPDIEVRLLVAEGEEDREVVATSTSMADGSVSFSGVTVPQGALVFFVEAADECGVHRSGKRTYVWDGLGFPQCELSLSAPPVSLPEVSELPVLTPEQDADDQTLGFQARVRVEAGRPDMEVRIFVVDQESGDAQEFSLDTQSDGSVEQIVTLEQGEQAMRAVCIWEPEELRPSTPTWQYFVQ